MVGEQAERSWQEELQALLPDRMKPYLSQRDGYTKFLEELPGKYNPEDMIHGQKGYRVWELIGLHYRAQNRFFEALPIYASLYNHMLLGQQKKSIRFHKGMPLVWMSECYLALGYNAVSKRYLMLTLVEDSIREEGIISPDTSGTYFRLVWRYGLPDSELKRYSQEIFQLSKENPVFSMYPEWVLQGIDQDWMTEFPAPIEAAFYAANTRYIKFLISQLGESTGTVMEVLAEYLLSCMPGCRTKRRQKTASTDYDIICSMDGIEVDYRSEFGRYFVCECKDWHKPADFTTLAKFCRVLDSTKSQFGILFSRSGISGEGETTNAEREQLKVFQDRGMVIVVVSQQDLERIADGRNFISLLRAKYERVRLDLLNSD